MEKSELESLLAAFIHSPYSLKKLLLGFPLWILSYLYACKRFFPSLKKALRLEAKVISIGNLTVGGSGKTPLTLYLAKQLVKNNALAVLSRGYKAEVEKQGGAKLVKEPGQAPNYLAAECGDEPYLIATHLDKAWVWSGPDRALLCKKAVEKGARLLLLDDAFQNNSVIVDAHVVILREEDLFKKPSFLPFGPFRDDFSSLSRCQLLIINRCCKYSIDTVLKKAQSLFKGPVCSVIMQALPYLSNGKEQRPRSLFQSKRCLCFAGIAHPQSFFQSLKIAGPHRYLSFQDHQKYGKKQLDYIKEQADDFQADCLICTEKDWVKIDPCSLPYPLYFLPLHLEVETGQEELRAFLSLWKN